MKGKGVRTELLTAITQLTGQRNVVVVPRAFIEYTGDLRAAVLLSQLLYWSDRSDDGWFFKSYQDWWEEIGLTEKQVRSARKALEGMGVLETDLRKAKGAPTVHYRVKMAELGESIRHFWQNRFGTFGRMESAQRAESYTEITTEITTENKGDAVASRVLAYLNERAGRSFRDLDRNRSGIRARVSEGFSEEDCRRVVDAKVAEWKGSDMEKHLNPETLFRPSKFEKYLQQWRPAVSSSDPLNPPCPECGAETWGGRCGSCGWQRDPYGG